MHLSRRFREVALALLIAAPVPLAGGTAPAGAAPGMAPGVALARALPGWESSADDAFPRYDLGTLNQPSNVRGRDAGVSGVVGGRSFWIFGDTGLVTPPAGRTHLITNTGGWNAPGYLPLSETAPGGTPPAAPFIPFSSGEAAFNADPANIQNNRRYAVWPSAVIGRDTLPDQQDGLIFLVRARYDGTSQVEGSQGTGIATLAQGSTTPVRRESLLFGGEDCQWLGHFLAEDGFVYAYADLSTPEAERTNCPFRSGNAPLGVARAPLAQADVKGAYTYWAGPSVGWSTNQNATVAALHDFHSMSVAWSDALGKYVSIYGYHRSAWYRTADQPQGPWSAPDQFVTGLPYAGEGPGYMGLGDYAWTLHGEHQSGDDGVLLVSYVRPRPGFLYSENRLLAVDVRPGASANRADYVDRLYRTLLGRSADSSGETYWSGRLGNGTTTPYGLAFTLAYSEEGRRRTIDQAYLDVLGRNADQGGSDYWYGQMVQHGWGHDVLVAKLASGAEFSGPHPNTSAGNAAYVAAVFPVVLGRSVDSSGLAYWRGQLDSGTSRDAMVRSLAGSSEAGRRQADLAYQDILGRTATTAQRTYVGGHEQERTLIRLQVAATAEAFGA